MSDFGFPSSSSSSSGGMNGAQKEQLMDNVRNQVLLETVQGMLTQMSDKCFQKCIYKPGTQLENSEQKCIAMCMDRYMDAWNTVSKAYQDRLQREHGQSGGAF